MDKLPRYEFHNEHIILPEKNIVEGKNNITIKFIAGNQSLNRNDEFLYTLLVPDRARTLFPLFRTAESESHIFLTTGIYQQNGKLFPIPILLKKKTKGNCKTVTFAPN